MAPGLWCSNSVAAALGFSCSAACRILGSINLGQGSNMRLPHWQADPLPLSHQGSPSIFKWYIDHYQHKSGDNAWIIWPRVLLLIHKYHHVWLPTPMSGLLFPVPSLSESHIFLARTTLVINIHNLGNFFSDREHFLDHQSI